MTMIDGAAPGGSVRLTPTPAWLSPASYWQPAHVVTSAWLEHAPFAFWLVDAVRPRSVVELGTHHGFSCFVFAEAVKRLGLDADIHALDTWAGDDQAGFYGEEVYASVRAIVESDYPGRVHLLRGWFADSRPAIGDGTVDLLHIDGRHGYDDVREDFEEWITVVREGGIVLFHDIEERENGFGVWRLWEELAAEHPSFAFTHGHGLGIIGVGAVESDAVRELFAADAATRARIRAQYEALGAVVSRQAALEAMPAEIESLHALVASLDDQVSRLRDEVRQGEDVVSDYRQSTSWRITRPLRAIGGMLHRDR
ncbi:MAG TPA: class I SAM-dependent methyltransferase [Microbacterium sp.]|nr:class I SAM-dependent methyltransferase [Microbacterium sp.]